MLLADVNLFIYAHRPESPRFAEHQAWLTDALTGDEPFGVFEQILSSFLRIVTNHRVYHEPTPPETALEFCHVILTAPATVRIHPGQNHWRIFEGLCKHLDARGNTIPDAYLAATAIEAGATFITTDAGFARFPGLTWRRPFG
ncbi:PIN domain-containing protein [Arachnia propionica]|uniref:Ribonuclease VapC n=1 Tax=Arachnia propionica TaxID=1750 RepID=A0A3P1T1Q6_9ACTN|nr:type II toxin-antitoxin system VapC family toxin [Arachnia propionica]MDO5084047.1 type II toxin-antitoxin system VapC family toxin [Arachnia propionica]RRD03294.1 PIN domain-containing protein [Arachnia propionica]